MKKLEDLERKVTLVTYLEREFSVRYKDLSQDDPKMYDYIQKTHDKFLKIIKPKKESFSRATRRMKEFDKAILQIRTETYIERLFQYHMHIFDLLIYMKGDINDLELVDSTYKNANARVHGFKKGYQSFVMRGGNLVNSFFEFLKEYYDSEGKNRYEVLENLKNDELRHYIKKEIYSEEFEKFILIRNGTAHSVTPLLKDVECKRVNRSTLFLKDAEFRFISSLPKKEQKKFDWKIWGMNDYHREISVLKRNHNNFINLVDKVYSLMP
ncbi:MAG: hypothetical protein KAU20_08015 [Nanoarchaeota archaeon]|nr:hypothetical protein [Nanoarchaeota archaeon]